MMEVHTTSENCIKPSQPTPSHLQNLKLSNHHSQAPDIRTNLTFFFSSNFNNPVQPGDHDATTNFTLQSKLVQNSLATTLTILYPFAGRFRNDDTIICKDDGAFFIEAKTDTKLSDFLAQPDLPLAIMDKLVPVATDAKYNGSLLILKFTLFGCGGSAVTISITHKISDLATILTLLNCWTALSRGGDGGGSSPFIQPDLNFIGRPVPSTSEVPPPSSGKNFIPPNSKYVTKRFIFSAAKIKELKARVINKIRKEEDNVFPSRVDVVLALIWKCALASVNSGSRSGNAQTFRPSVMMQAVNLRNRTDPPLPESSIGNLAILLPVWVEKEEDTELHELVSRLLTVKVRANRLKKKYQGYEDPEQVIISMESDSVKEIIEVRKKLKDFSTYVAASVVNAPLYDVDFGWGKPAWVTSTPNTVMANSIYLLDTKDAGGIEVLMNMLKEEDMIVFESNQELLQSAMVNPTII
ncbi:vinorine synthase-like [Quillaja saponaria]|uniref:Vinorine synthase-like n=1 Tax=Quillaja saponaria TaxID=32244 RepID=A0AAD7L1W9_QUISA|nr:vinorine synthase-like [Quillaja saponaria]WLD47566.1 ACT2 [Quillaja saponaria]